jgi:hypothetical protein
MKALIVHIKEKWMMKHNEDWQAEFYLGRLPFHEELERSCGESYSLLKYTWGHCPTKLDYAK